MGERARKAEQAFLERGKKKVDSNVPAIGGHISSVFKPNTVDSNVPAIGGHRVATPASSKATSSKKVGKKPQPVTPNPKTPNPFRAQAWAGSARSPSCTIGKTSPQAGCLTTTPTQTPHAKRPCVDTPGLVDNASGEDDVRYASQLEADASMPADGRSACQKPGDNVRQSLNMEDEDRPEAEVDVGVASEVSQLGSKMRALSFAEAEITVPDLKLFRSELEGVVDSAGKEILRMPDADVQASAIAVLCSIALVERTLMDALEEDDLVDAPLPPEAWAKVQERMRNLGNYKALLKSFQPTPQPMVVEMVEKASAAVSTILEENPKDASCPVAHKLLRWIDIAIHDADFNDGVIERDAAVGNTSMADVTSEVPRTDKSANEELATSLLDVHHDDDNLLACERDVEATVNINCLKHHVLMTNEGDDNDHDDSPRQNIERSKQMPIESAHSPQSFNDYMMDEKTSPFILCALTRDVLSPPVGWPPVASASQDQSQNGSDEDVQRGVSSTPQECGRGRSPTPRSPPQSLSDELACELGAIGGQGIQGTSLWEPAYDDPAVQHGADQSDEHLCELDRQYDPCIGNEGLLASSPRGSNHSNQSETQKDSQIGLIEECPAVSQELLASSPRESNHSNHSGTSKDFYNGLDEDFLVAEAAAQRLKEEQLKAEEERVAAEAAELIQTQDLLKAEEERLATEAEEQRLKQELLNAEEERLAAEAAVAEARLKAEEERLAAEAAIAEEMQESLRAEKQRLEEEQLKIEEERLAAEAAAAEEKRFIEERLQAEDERLAAERAAAEERLKAEQLQAEEERLAAEAEAAEERRRKQAEAEGLAAERASAEQQQRRKEERRLKAEEERLAEEREAADQQRLNEELRLKAEEERLAEEREAADQQRRNEEQLRAEEIHSGKEARSQSEDDECAESDRQRSGGNAVDAIAVTMEPRVPDVSDNLPSTDAVEQIRPFSGYGSCAETTVELAEMLRGLPSKMPPPGTANKVKDDAANCVPTFADLGQSCSPRRQQEDTASQHTPRQGMDGVFSLKGGVGHIPPFTDPGPCGEATVELAKMLVALPKKAPPPGRAEKPIDDVATPPTFSDLGPYGEPTAALAQLLEGLPKQVPYRGQAEALPEQTEDMSELLRSAAARGLSSASTPQQRPTRSLPRRDFMQGSSSSSANGGMGPQLTNKFMESLEQYVEDSRRQADRDDGMQPLEEKRSGATDADILSGRREVPGGSRGLERLPGGLAANALRYVAAGKDAAEPHLSAASHYLGRGRQAAMGLLRECRGRLDRPAGNASPAGYTCWMLTRIMLMAMIIILLFFVAIEINYRLGPEPEDFL